MTDFDSGPSAARTSRSAGTRLTIEQVVLDRVTVLRASGEIDVLTAPHLDEAIDRALSTDGDEPRCGVVVDLSAVTFLASAGLAVLAAGAQPRTGGQRLVIVANRSATIRPLQVTGLTDLLSVYSTVPEAAEALRHTHGGAVDDLTAQADTPS
ncbi:STAS domain-containing protein [Nocardia colli]|uniref:Anti-sigma factor antagonist n=1 Tax=Nocardia colli TaxID=2545717 RepID=A0A5N0EJG2_9NOCA|nr:STAS domain-containing protein [Nocardia colli]KAA8889402.1 STAS domain-containing protein [Nocardia colli]